MLEREIPGFLEGGLVPANINFSPMTLDNFNLKAVISTNAIVISVVDRHGSDPSPTLPARVAMRHPTVTTGTYNLRLITAALSLTISDGSTLGATASETIRIYVWLIDSDAGGAMKLVASRQALSDWSALATTVAEGGAGAADDNETLYSDAAYSAKPIRLVGILEATSGVTPGNWSTVDLVSVWVPGMRKTGDIVDKQTTEDGTSYSTATTTPAQDTSIPLSTEGAAIKTISYTATNAINRIYLEAQYHVGGSGTNAIIVFVCKDSGNATKTTAAGSNGANGSATLVLSHTELAGSIVNVDWKFRFGTSSGTAYINRTGTDDLFGTTLVTTYIITEVYV